MDRIKLKWRIFIFLLGFCALLLLLLWLFQTVLLNDMYKYIREKEIKTAISYVQEHINSPELPAILDTLLRDKEIAVTKTNEFVPPQPQPQDERGYMRQETITKTQVFILEDGQELSLTFHAIITPVNATVTTLQMQLYIVIGIMLLMSVILAAIIAKKISKPLEDINSSAKILAKGDYSVLFAGKGFLEIRELSDTLNTAARDLSKVESLRRELMANVSHDLRTPLSLIYSYSEMMHDFPEEITEEQTQVIMDETKRLTSLVNDMLDFSKLESGLQELCLSACNLTQMLRKTTERTAELVKQSGYSLCFAYDGEYMVYADEVKITQAYYNLLINALNYCGEDHRVEVRQKVENGIVRIEVADNGEGIAVEELPYIWDRYYKSKKNHKRAVTGSGLGLSIVRKVFELHHAQYGVTSEIGKGSVFWFQLPYEPKSP
ncbi:MAG: HAMP domain-containing histidine kinase [Clostridia bacterium]|nr:HAMP domain-containing histidine kinase [Clostridia bacterium]